MVVDAAQDLSVHAFVFEQRQRTPFILATGDESAEAFRQRFTSIVRSRAGYVRTHGPGCIMSRTINGHDVTADLIPAKKVLLRFDLPIDGRAIDEWQNKVYAIPKQFVGEGGQRGWHWRLSFSVLEKEYIRVNTNASQKTALRIVKYLGMTENFRGLTDARVKSYWLKNVWLQLCDEGWGGEWNPRGERKDNAPRDDQLRLTLQFVDRLRQMLEKQRIDCFFLPSVNLLHGANVRWDDAHRALTEIGNQLRRILGRHLDPWVSREVRLQVPLQDLNQGIWHVIRLNIQLPASQQSVRLIRQGRVYSESPLNLTAPGGEAALLVLQLRNVARTTDIQFSLSSELQQREP